ncbi:MAG: hypothetical protein GX097_02640 [Methanomicrobiales archaeon]|nr:hypothetical protein [Methanomicrobiales archaeon]
MPLYRASDPSIIIRLSVGVTIITCPKQYITCRLHYYFFSSGDKYSRPLCGEKITTGGRHTIHLTVA